MSSFFGKLAERTLGTAPAVQPALAPLFAPGPSLSGTLSAHVTEDSLEEAQPRVEPDGQVAVTPPSALQDALPQPPRGAGRMRAFSERFEGRALEHFDFQASTSARRSSIVASNVPSMLPVGEPFAPALTPLSSEANPLSGSRTGDEQDMVQSRVPLLRAGNPEMHTPASASVSPRRLSSEGAQAETAPTVRISIGRIDVRAVHHGSPSTPQARPANKAASSSLESYLQARNRGKP